MRRVVLAAVALAFAFAPRASATTTPTADCAPNTTTCEGGPVVTTTVGTTSYAGLLYVPGDAHVFDVQQRGDGCATCRWEVVVICTAATAETSDCVGGQTVCAVTDTYLELRLYVNDVIQDLSHWCRNPSDPEPVGLDELVPSAADLERLVAVAPALHADPPPSRVLVQLPAYLWADAPAPQRATAAVTGHPGLTLTLRLTPAAWLWTFGDGSPKVRTDVPGGPYPNGQVRHTYRAVGSVAVSVTTAWQAQATLTTPFGALPSRIEPRAVSSPAGRERLTVREAHTVLIGRGD